MALLLWFLLCVVPSQAQVWTQVSTTNTIDGRYASTLGLSTSQNKLWTFSGYIGTTWTTAELAYMDTQTSTWTVVSDAAGTTPVGRLDFSLVLDDTTGRMYIFGGRGSSTYNDLHYYDTIGNQWYDLSGASGTAPSTRYAHAATWDPDTKRMYIWGGYGGGRLNDLHYYDTQANSWTEVSLSGTAPTGLYHATLVWSPTDKRIYLFGGTTNTGSFAAKQDLYYVDTQAVSWNGPIATTGVTPAARHAHAAAWSTSQSKMVIYGGHDSSSSTRNDLLFYDPSANEWTRQTGDFLPKDLYFFAFAFDADADRLWLFSGRKGADQHSDVYYNDLQATTTSSTATTQTITSSTATTVTSTSTSSSTSSSSTMTSSTTTSSSSATSTTSSSSSTSESSTTSRSSSSTSSSTSTSSSRSSSTSSTTTSSSSTTKTTTSSTSSSTSSSSTSRSTTSSSTTSSSTTSSSTTSSSSSTTSVSSSSTLTTSSTTWTQTSSTSSTVTSTSTTSTSMTTTSSTRTEAPALTPQQLAELERQRKEAAAQAVAAVDAAESEAVLQALTLLGNSTTPGVLGEVVLPSSVGPVEVSMLSLDSWVGTFVWGSQVEGGTGVELTAGLMQEVVAIAGGGNVLMSRVSLTPEASWNLRNDHVLAEGSGRRLASQLRSQAASLNFWSISGTKLKVQNLAHPMKVVIPLDDPNATCAYWDESLATWSAEGLEMAEASNGALVCRTQHLSIFGGVIKALLRNVLLALKCSTFSSLMTAEAFVRLAQLDLWLPRPASVVTWVIVLLLLLCLFLTARADRRSFDLIPWSEREQMLLRVKEKEEEEEEEKESPSETSKEQEPSGEYQEDGPSKPSASRRHSVSSQASEKSDGSKHSLEKKAEDVTGGDWDELPSVFRAFRGIAEGLLDLVSQATGGDNFVDGFKEFVANAETGTVNSSIEMLHSHRSGADANTLQVIQNSGVHTASLRQKTVASLSAGEQRREPEAAPEPAPPPEPAPAEPVEQVLELEDVKSEDERPNERRRSSVGSVGSVMRGLVGMAGENILKVQNWYGNVAQQGSTSAMRFLNSGPLCRALMLFPAAHNWAKVFQLSIMVSYSVRVALIGMKVISSGWLNALFFSSSAPTPDSDPECDPPQDPFERLVQSVTVGFVTAFLSDGIIFMIFLIQRKRVIEKKEWTDQALASQKRWWRRRERMFWFTTFVYLFFITLYTFLFISNVREVDADQWLEATLTSLFQDFVFKPFVVCVILTVMSSLMLCCKPNLRKEIEEEWGADSCKNTVEELSDNEHEPIVAGENRKEGPDQRASDQKGSAEKDFQAVLPGTVEA